ncbi:hypothetical protein Efla_004912 [Eimeria flavescens]
MASFSFLSLSACLLNLPLHRRSLLGALLLSPILGFLHGLFTWLIYRAHASISYRLYNPSDYGSFQPSVGLRLLHLLLHASLSFCYLFNWVFFFLLLGGSLSLPSLVFSVAAVVVCRLGCRVLLQLLSLSANVSFAAATDSNPLSSSAETEGRGGAPGGLLSLLSQKAHLAADVHHWLGALASLPDFYGPSDVSRRPSCFDLYFYLESLLPTSPSPTEAFCFKEQQQQPAAAAAAAAAGGRGGAASERLLQHEIEGGPPSAAASAAAFYNEEADYMGPLEEAAEECAAFLGMPGGGPCLASSCCCVAAGAEQAAALLFMWVDGSLSFISLGGLTLLLGARLPAGVLLSGAPLFAATCALSAALLAACKKLLFRLLHASYGYSAPGGAPGRRAALDGGGAPGGAPYYYRLADEEGGAANTLRKLQDALSVRDILERLKTHTSSSSSGSNSITEKQLQLLQRLHTGDLEEGPFNPDEQQQHQQQQHQQQHQEEEHLMGPAEHVPAFLWPAGPPPVRLRAPPRQLFVGPPCRGPRGPPPRALLSSPAQEKLALLRDGKERSGVYALVEVGGFQRWMEPGRFYDLNRVQQTEGGRLLLLRVLMLQQAEGATLVGQPFLENVRVWARVLQHFRGPKVLVGKHRPKKWRKKRGHRQALSRILIEEIEDVERTRGIKQNQLDPLYSVLMAIRRQEKPSLHLARAKAQGLKVTCREELPLLGSDPLALLDPRLNQLVADRLAAGQTEILPILGETHTAAHGFDSGNKIAVDAAAAAAAAAADAAVTAADDP